MEWPAGSFFTLFNKEKATCDRLGENMRLSGAAGRCQWQIFLTDCGNF
jgi:hypothetical protein